jgi:hypothetical protein
MLLKPLREDTGTPGAARDTPAKEMQNNAKTKAENFIRE